MAMSSHAGTVAVGGVVRQYYIAAERQLWDHIPQKTDACSGVPQPLTGDNALRAFNNASLGTIGSQRWRGTFYEYTDAPSPQGGCATAQSES